VNKIGYTILHRKDREEIIIAFSGTSSYSQLIAEVTRSFFVKYEIHPDFAGAKVMDYFYTFYVDHFRNDLLDQLKNHLQVHPDDTVVFTGHSLGGAMSVHGAIDTILGRWIDKSQLLVYTFGQPRVGNRVFIDTLNKGTRGNFRVINFKDAVSHVPPCIPNFTNHGCHDEGFLPFYPLHSSTEVWYSEGMHSFRV
jgi:predicted lipase